MAIASGSQSLQWVFESQLTDGKGGHGTVWRGHHCDLEYPVAIKVLNTETSDPNAFRAEAKLLMKCKHPNVVKVVDFGPHPELEEVEGDQPYLVMEFLDGRTLDRVLHELSGEQIRKLVREIGSALAHAHAIGLVHRDLKPQNIMMVAPEHPGDEGRFVLIDFGIAKKIDGTQTTRNMSMDGLGTPQYMACEQFDGRGDFPVDIYAFGVILYEVFTGRVPFLCVPHDSLMRTLVAFRCKLETEAPPPFREIWPEGQFTPEIEALVRRCVGRDPEDRPGSIQEVVDEFLRVFDAASFRPPPGAAPPADPTYSSTPPRRPIVRSPEPVHRQPSSGTLTPDTAETQYPARSPEEFGTMPARAGSTVPRPGPARVGNQRRSAGKWLLLGLVACLTIAGICLFQAQRWETELREAGDQCDFKRAKELLDGVRLTITWLVDVEQSREKLPERALACLRGALKDLKEKPGQGNVAEIRKLHENIREALPDLDIAAPFRERRKELAEDVEKVLRLREFHAALRILDGGELKLIRELSGNAGGPALPSTLEVVQKWHDHVATLPECGKAEQYARILEVNRESRRNLDETELRREEFLSQGRCHLEQRNLAEALVSLSKGLDLVPKPPGRVEALLRHARAKVRLEQGKGEVSLQRDAAYKNWQLALDDLDAALVADSANPELKPTRAEVYWQRGQSRALQKPPDVEAICDLRAMLLDDPERRDKAEEKLRLLSEDAWDKGMKAMKQGEKLLEDEQLEPARTSFSTAVLEFTRILESIEVLQLPGNSGPLRVEHLPEDWKGFFPEVWRWRATARLDLGAPDYFGAVKDLENWLDRPGKQRDLAGKKADMYYLGALITLASYYAIAPDERLRDKAPRALELAQEAMKLTEGKDADAILALAAALAATGDFKGASSQLKDFDAIVPANTPGDVKNEAKLRRERYERGERYLLDPRPNRDPPTIPCPSKLQRNPPS